MALFKKHQSNSLKDPQENEGSYKTIKPDPVGAQSFTSHMASFFALTAVMTVLVLISVLGIVWEIRFTAYTRENLQNTVNTTALNMSQAYARAEGWTADVLSIARQAASSNPDIGIQVLDVSGVVLYDNSAPNARRSGVNGASSGPQTGDAVVYAVVQNLQGESVGSIRIWTFGSEPFLTQRDIAFRNGSYQAISLAAAIAISLSGLIGILASRSLTKPVRLITETAVQIRSGNLAARSGIRGENELGRLGETFDDMASSLERDIKLERRLTSDVAHELRTPLMAIMATVEAIQDGILPADEERLENIVSESRRLSRLVDAMLHLSRLENGKTKFNPESVNVVAMVASIVAMQETLFKENNRTLTFVDKTPEGNCFVDIDSDMIREALTNLLSNAIRYTDDGGHVVITVSIDNTDAVISVADDGMGIAPEDIPQTFSRFWRAEESRERASGGLGVGLAITKEIMDRHNGTISVESELGKGTTFSLYLPILAQNNISVTETLL